MVSHTHIQRPKKSLASWSSKSANFHRALKDEINPTGFLLAHGEEQNATRFFVKRETRPQKQFTPVRACFQPKETKQTQTQKKAKLNSRRLLCTTGTPGACST